MKLNVKQTILVGLAFASICAFWQVYDGIVPLILKNTFGMKDTLAGVVMALDNVLALFLLPFFGALSDKTTTKIGKRMPFIITGTAISSVCLIVLPLADRAKNFSLFIVGLGIVLLAMSIYRSPAVALMPDVTPKEFRSKGNAVINLMGAVGGIVMLITITFLVPSELNPNYMPLFAFTAFFMLICVAILFITIKEPKILKTMKQDVDTDVQENSTANTGENKKLPKDVFRSLILILCSVFLWFMGYNAITTAFSKYAVTMWGMEGGEYATVLMVAQVAAILTYIPVGVISSKFGRKKTIQAGIILLATAFGTAALFKNFSSIILVLFAMAGIAWAFINVNSYPMVVEMSDGADVGKYTGYYYTFSMSAQIITPILSGAVMEYFGYRFLFPYGALFVLASFFTMMLVKHGDHKPLLQKGLEAFDVDD